MLQKIDKSNTNVITNIRILNIEDFIFHSIVLSVDLTISTTVFIFELTCRYSTITRNPDEIY